MNIDKLLVENYASHSIFKKKLKTEPVGKIMVLFGAKPHSFSTLGSILETKSTRLGLPRGSNEDEAL